MPSQPSKLLASLQDRVLLSADSVVPSNNDTAYSNIPLEVLNQLQPSDLPVHHLRLKVGAPIILLRDMHKQSGFVEGARLVVQNIQSRVMQAMIISGSHLGKVALIPRLTMSSTNDDQPFSLRRIQFPIRVAFTMSIDQAQGRTFNRIGIYLPAPRFTHKQLHDAMSVVGGEGVIHLCTADN